MTLPWTHYLAYRRHWRLARQAQVECRQNLATGGTHDAFMAANGTFWRELGLAHRHLDRAFLGTVGLIVAFFLLTLLLGALT